MKLFYLLLFLLTAPLTTISQEISLSPTSLVLWGQADKSPKLSLTYKNWELTATKAVKPLYFYEEPGAEGLYKGTFIGLFWVPPIIAKDFLSLSAGPGIWNRPFPENGQRVHLTIQLQLRVTRTLAIEYSHYSNGFGIMNKLNPGLDNLSLVINLNH